MANNPMTCPKCGNAMNHHADKVIYSGAPDDATAQNVFGGIIEETHTCPGCGAVATRRAA